MYKYLFFIIVSFIAAIIAIYQWERIAHNWEPQVYTPKYTQCASVYVRKSPHPCTAGDLIYIDIDVADKYCTSNVIATFDDSVYCQYNGFRDDLADLTKDVYERPVPNKKKEN